MGEKGDCLLSCHAVDKWNIGCGNSKEIRHHIEISLWKRPAFLFLYFRHLERWGATIKNWQIWIIWQVPTYCIEGSVLFGHFALGPLGGCVIMSDLCKEEKKHKTILRPQRERRTATCVTSNCRALLHLEIIWTALRWQFGRSQLDIITLSSCYMTNFNESCNMLGFCYCCKGSPAKIIILLSKAFVA